MKYKAIVSDIDGTLVPFKMDALPSKLVREAIQKVQKSGIPFCLASGRPFDLVEYIARDLQITSPLIVDNGAAIYDPQTQRVLWQALIDQDLISHLVKVIKKYQRPFNVSTAKQNLDGEQLATIPNDVRKFVVHGLKPKQAELLVSQVESISKNLNVIGSSANEGEAFVSVYISDANASKQHAVLELSKILHIETKNMLAIGDHYNDFPLFMACGYRVAMGNAVDDLKAIADYIAPSVDEDGAAHVIEKFFLRPKN